MEILGFLGILGAVVVIGGLLIVTFYYFGVVFSVLFLHNFGPTLFGITVCVFLWRSGLDNIGVLFAIGGIVGNFYWLKSPLSKKVDAWLGKWLPMYKDTYSRDRSNPMAGKVARYDKDGKVIGYQDRE
ncbi:hypothetical protein [[Limnothrix rosea] IAM M-220]|uniref:hypothetical protein n=1 Tax=[Limnothrix rosea] IAM M-220 TaxID=454133 RepID=UPI00095B5797|nr:hypothetical protein [[Limnothrix rosea] IAM M-220]OKH12020.1 hypothetical protein NIES208_16640 [[Limnothrix rosea] IAM M-220]